MKLLQLSTLILLFPILSFSQSTKKKEPIVVGAFSFNASIGAAVPVGKFSKTHKGGPDLNIGFGYSFKRSAVGIIYGNSWFISKQTISFTSQFSRDIYFKSISGYYSTAFPGSKRFFYGGSVNYSWTNMILINPSPEDPNKKSGIGAGIGVGYSLGKSFSIQTGYNYLKISNKNYSSVNIGVATSFNFLIIEKQRK